MLYYGLAHTGFFQPSGIKSTRKRPELLNGLKEGPFQNGLDPWKKNQKKNSVDGDVVDKFSKIKPNTTRINYGKMLIFGIELIRMSLNSLNVTIFMTLPIKADFRANQGLSQSEPRILDNSSKSGQFGGLIKIVTFKLWSR